jgi:hypothetical protein
VLLQDASRAGAVKWAAEAAPLHDTEHVEQANQIAETGQILS